MAAVTNATWVASIPGAAFYDDFEDTPIAPSTFSAGLPTNFPVLPNTGLPVRGKRLTKGVNTYAYATFFATPDTGGSTTYTVTAHVALEPNAKNVDLVNHAVRLEARIGILTSGTSLADDSALGTATAATATMGSALGVVSTVTFAIAYAAGGVIPGALALIRIGRLSMDAADTNQGSVVLLGASITVA